MKVSELISKLEDIPPDIDIAVVDVEFNVYNLESAYEADGGVIMKISLLQ